MIRNYISALFLLLLCVVICPSKPEAARFTGAYLLHICDMDQSGKEMVKGGHTACQAYISGVIDYHNTLRAMNIAPAVDICIPENARVADLQEIVLQYLKDNVQHDAFIIAPVVVMALNEVFPCR
jgi:hypothetical protein